MARRPLIISGAGPLKAMASAHTHHVRSSGKGTSGARWGDDAAAVGMTVLYMAIITASLPYKHHPPAKVLL